MKARTDIPRVLGTIPLPRLGDDAVIQIHDFLHHLIDVFEVRYGEQIDRFYEELCQQAREAEDADDSPY